MTTRDDFDRIARAWLADGPAELPDRVLDAAFEEIHRLPRRRRMAPWRLPMTSTLKVAAAAAVLVAAVVASSTLLNRGGSPPVGASASPTMSSAPSASAEPSTAIVPGVSQRLEAGRYTTDLVRPAVTMDLPCCFEVMWHAESLLVLAEVGLARYLVFANPDEVVDPATGDARPLPDDLVDWLAEHPGLDVEPASSVTIGGLDGRQVAGAPRPDATYNVDGELTLAHGTDPGAAIFVASDHRFRLAVVDGPAGPVLIGVVARADRFDKFSTRAEAILDTVRFGE